MRIKNWVFQPLHTWKNIIDTKYLESVFTSSDRKALQLGKVKNHRTKLHIALTDLESVEAFYVSDAPSDVLMEAICASCNIPGASDSEYRINSRLCGDGMIGEPFPKTFFLKHQPEPTHVLVITNQPLDGFTFSEKFGNYLLQKLVFRLRLDAKLCQKIHDRVRLFIKDLNLYLNTHKSVAVVWTDDYLLGACDDKRKLKTAADRSEQWWLDMLIKQHDI